MDDHIYDDEYTYIYIFWPSLSRVALKLTKWQEMKHVSFQKYYALYDDVLVCTQLSRSLVLSF